MSTSPFNAATFSVPEERPVLTSPALETKQESNAFTEEFGLVWKRSPVKGVWFISSSKRDLVITYSTEGNSFYLYRCDLAAFKKAFSEETHIDQYGVYCEDYSEQYAYHFLHLQVLIEDFDAGRFDR